ncbi:hypothetical protein ACSQ6I_27060, partial [Anabaena sp. WFMT]
AIFHLNFITIIHNYRYRVNQTTRSVLMKNLIYAVVFTLSIVASVPTAWAKNPNDAKFSHLGNSAAVPNTANTPNATHKFDVHVQGKALSELSIVV